MTARVPAHIASIMASNNALEKTVNSPDKKVPNGYRYRLQIPKKLIAQFEEICNISPEHRKPTYQWGLTTALKQMGMDVEIFKNLKNYLKSHPERGDSWFLKVVKKHLYTESEYSFDVDVTRKITFAEALVKYYNEVSPTPCVYRCNHMESVSTESGARHHKERIKNIVHR